MILKTRNTVLEHGRLSDLQKFVELCQSLGALEPEKQEQHVGVLVVRQPAATGEEWEARYGKAARGKPAPEGFFKRKPRDESGGSGQ
jgi:hypothetical protein